MTCIYRYTTPPQLDDLWMRADGEYLTALWFNGSEDDAKHRTGCTEIKSYFSLPSVLKETCSWLDIYFSGINPSFTPKFKIEDITPFRQEVQDILLAIPFGQTVSYGEIATQIAKRHGIKKMSAQAVGNAVGWNPICIIIPCHRVIGTDGSLTGYGGGINNKNLLLTLEKR